MRSARIEPFRSALPVVLLALLSGGTAPVQAAPAASVKRAPAARESINDTPADRRPLERLAPGQARLLREWFQSVGPPRDGEPFGRLVARAALFQKGRRYFAPKQIDQRAGQTESLRLKLDNFDCISLIESSLALGRCIWQGRADEACFKAEVIASRFRGGRRGDYADRLHYFSEWLRDNRTRGRLRDLAPALGGRPWPRRIDWMSRHPDRYPALRRPAIARRIRRIEARLTDHPARVVSRSRLRTTQNDLRDGDLVAIVTNVRGILVTHAGLVVRRRGRPHLLHASQFHKGVVLDPGSLAQYLHRRPERLGALVARPLPPQTAVAGRP